MTVAASLDTVGFSSPPGRLSRVRKGLGWLRDRYADFYDHRTDKIIAERERRCLTEKRLEIRIRWREACERPQLTLSHGLTVPATGSATTTAWNFVLR